MQTVRPNKGISIIEYAFLSGAIVLSMVVMGPYINKAFNGYWKKSGDSLAFSRQYDAATTTDCGYSQISAHYGVWYDNSCFVQQVASCPPGNWGCEDQAKNACATPDCCENHTEKPGESNCN